MGELLKALQLSAERRGAGGNRARQMGHGISRGVANSAARAQAGSEEGGIRRAGISSGHLHVQGCRVRSKGTEMSGFERLSHV